MIRKYVDEFSVSATPWSVAIDPVLVDNKTEHESYIKYNFGAISSEAENEHNVTVTVETYKTIFSCPLVTEAQTLAWKQWESDDKKTKEDVNYLVYGSTATNNNVDLLEYITVSNKYDTNEFGPTMAGLLKSAKEASVEVRSNGTKNADYFKGTISFDSNTRKPTLSLTQLENAAPTADVKSEFVVIVKDAFGHTHEYSVPFTVKKK